MTELELKNYLDNFGRTYEDLLAEGVVRSDGLIAVYQDALTFFSAVEDGVYLRFWSETRALEVLSFALANTVPGSVLYKGALPAPFDRCDTRKNVLEVFGNPIQSKPPFKMPSPMGEVGGWDGFNLTDFGYDSLRVEFYYDTSLRVSKIAFLVALTGCERDANVED